jgi:O-acetyl-ADP-ribose deacetylase (regulator of RNase III)
MRARTTGLSSVAPTRPFWTHPSVLQLAGDRDPVEVITQRARDTVLGAIEEGWRGPPYDPFELAELMRVPAVPREDMYDARLVPAEGGRVRLEFNPTRPRGRVRFTIAHELAHTFFPDYKKDVRHRSGPKARSDEWQLELLCNIAAAELLMPIGSFRSLEEEPLKIERLMDVRKAFEVSTEALLLRVVHLTARPSAAFAAARIDADSPDSPFRLDYVIGSRSWASRLRRGLEIPPTSVLAEITAVGYTAKRRESWDGASELTVECVGIPPYPGQRLPRVVGLLLDSAGASVSEEITQLIGDATAPRGSGPRLIVHLVNDKTPSWGGPFARALKSRHPIAQDAFRDWAREPGHLKLGQVHVTDIDDDLAVATMVAQKGYGPSVKTRVRFASLRQCLEQVADIARTRGATVHMPRIGTGEGKAEWAIVRELIDDELARAGVDVTIYTLPGTPLREPGPAQLALHA